MIPIKMVGTAWMLTWYFIILHVVITQANEGASLGGSIFALVVGWFLFGFLPVIIAKLGWHYISYLRK